jgi:hypothetical protein
MGLKTLLAGGGEVGAHEEQAASPRRSRATKSCKSLIHDTPARTSTTGLDRSTGGLRRAAPHHVWW